MNAPNMITQSWDDQRVVFLHNLKIIRKRPSRKTVHDIRVAVKKMRAYLVLAAEYGAGPEIKSFDVIRKFFRVSGKFRDVEMSLTLLKKQASNADTRLAGFEKYLRSMLIITRNRTKENAALPVEPELDSCSQGFHSLLDSCTETEWADFVKKKGEQTLEELKPLLHKFSEHAHEIRKQLKLLFYWLRTCPDNPLLNKKEMKLLDAILIDLGNWQDYYVAGRKLKSFRKEYLVKGTEEFETARKLETDFDSIKERLLKDAAEKTEILLKK